MTRRLLLRLAARASPFLALLILLAFLPEGAKGYDIPYRDYYSQCYWWELDAPGSGYTTYDSSPPMPWWTTGVAEWDYAMDPLMRFYYVSWPSGQTALRWEGDEPGHLYCQLEEAFACWSVFDCSGGRMIEAAVYFDYDNYLSLGSDERIAVSAHEWGHGLNLGHTDGYFCTTTPHRIMAEWGPDGVGCITGPTPPEAYTVAEFYGWGGFDWDGDDFVDSVEVYLATDPFDDCPDNPSDDAWPLDINMDRSLSLVGDVLNFVGRMGATEGDANWWYRLDLNVDGAISLVGDVSMYTGRIGEECT